MYICNGSLHSCKEVQNFQYKTSTGLRRDSIATMENVLEIEAIYKIRCDAWRFESNHASFVEYKLTVNSPPIKGYCVVTPKEGFALESLFDISCFGWWDREKPLTYLIGMLNIQVYRKGIQIRMRFYIVNEHEALPVKKTLH